MGLNTKGIKAFDALGVEARSEALGGVLTCIVALALVFGGRLSLVGVNALLALTGAVLGRGDSLVLPMRLHSSFLPINQSNNL